MSKLKLFYICAGVILGVIAIGYLSKDRILQKAFSPTSSQVKQAGNPTFEEVVIDSLDTPWEIAFLPDKTMLITERSGSLHHLSPSRTVVQIPGVVESGEGGLLGMAVHPKYGDNNLLYFYYTTEINGEPVNKVESYKFFDGQLLDRRVIIGNIPGSTNHDGGRISFGPDGYLYITTGDAGNEQTAQDTVSLSGKILRVKDDGSIPEDNPFGNEVYSYGHRNPQGIAWDGNGNLWSTEHGPSGLQTGHDELNKIEKGKNYGWPDITGEETKAGMVSPVSESGSDDIWAPAGMAYYNGHLYFAGLRGQSLYRANLKTDNSFDSLEMTLNKKYGRLRAVTTGPDGYLYISTSNRDGRGSPSISDDKIVRIKF